ncbi:hemagglutinin repeat-containing protein [Escherichia coli]|uniref:hemagglutinin repeat-containing protein n=1 Tax=Escherichia coli TaxID=562 RepID=UPI000CFB4FFE|nr:hemagglutinin repeat-containing protein [Escherichia coli]
MTHFKLSAAGKLTVALAIALIVTTPASAAGIIAGGANQPQVSTNAQGTDIINIVAPSASGLSHNQYQNYSVDGSGAVLNNALQAGQSQLAGRLQANSNLHGQAAKIILNEVVTRNPSLLLGQQEVFGIAADFVLANPNGITCNGCGFINTPRSSLVVGSPNVIDGNLHSYTTLNNRNALQIGQGGVHGADVLDIIAPKIDARGPITAGYTIHALSGLNEISSDGKITYSAPVGGNGLDSYYLGGMQAGRIRLVNTAVGSGVNISGVLKAAQGIDANSRGDMTLTAANLYGGGINLTAQNLTLRGEVQHHEQSSQGADNYQNYRGGIDRGSHQQEESLTRSSLHGNDIKLVSRRHQHLSATDVDGQQVTLQGRTVVLDNQVTRNSLEKHNNQWLYSWEHNESSSSLNEVQHGTQILATKQVQVIADQDVTLTGSRIDSGNDLSIKAGGKLALQGAQEQHRSQRTLYVKNETAALRSGTEHQETQDDKLQQAALHSGGHLTLQAGDNLRADAADLKAAGNLNLSSAKQLQLGIQEVQAVNNNEKNHRYWGGIGGANETEKNRRDTRVQSTHLQSGQSLLLNGQQGVELVSTDANACQGGYVSSNGDIHIRSASNSTQERDHNRTNTVFNITKYAEIAATQDTRSQGSNLRAKQDLKVNSGQNVTLIGSRLQSQGTTNINAGKTLHIKQGTDTHQSSKEIADLHGRTYTRKAGDNGYRAGAGLEFTRYRHSKSSQTAAHSQISGRDLALKASENVSVQGGELSSKQDTTLSGKNIALVGAKESHSQQDSHLQTGIGIYVHGGLERAGLGLESSTSHSRAQSSSQTEQGPRIHTGGNLILNASGSLTQQGAQHTVQGNYKENTAKSSHVVSANRSQSSASNTSVTIDLGATVDYSAITRPAVETVKKIAYADVDDGKASFNEAIQGIPELQGTLQVNVDHKTNSQEYVTQRGTLIQASNIAVNTQGKLTDQSSQYQATAGNIDINSGSYEHRAAQDKMRKRQSLTTSNLSVAAATTTGKDLRLSGEFGINHQSESQYQQSSHQGSLQATHDVNITSHGDSILSGVAINAGQYANLQAGQKLTIKGAEDHAQSNSYHAGGSLSVKGIILPAPTDANGGGSLNLGYTSKNQDDGQKTQIDAGNNLRLHSYQNLSVQDTDLHAGQNAALRSDQGSVSLSGGQSQQNTKDGDIELALNASRKQNLVANDVTTDNAVTGTAPSTTSTVSSVVKAGNGSVKLNGSMHREVRQHSNNLQATNVTINSAQDTRLQNSRVKGVQVAITSGGNLQLDSHEDRVLDLSAKFNVSANHTDAPDSKGNSVRLGQSVLKNSTLDSEGHVLRGHEITQSSQVNARDDVTLQISGETRLHAAQINSEQGKVKQIGSAAVLIDNQGHKAEASWKMDIANGLRHLFGGKDSESKEKLPITGQYQQTDYVTHSSITEGKEPL